MIARIIEVTFMLVLAYLILKNASGFSSAVRSVGSVYTSSVKALQGN